MTYTHIDSRTNACQLLEECVRLKAMKQFGLRYLYKHLGQVLKSLPFEITNHNKVIAVVARPEDIKPKVRKEAEEAEREEIENE